MGSTLVDSLASALCNWGRWGEADQLGTVNFITPQKVKAASALIRTGEVFPLGLKLGPGGPQIAHPRRFNPLHYMTAMHDTERPGGSTSADDILVLPLQAATQWDSLAHVGHKGYLYGGRPTSEVTVEGAQSDSIEAISGKIATRGVLLDIARWRGVEVLPRGYAIGSEDLEGCASAQEVEVSTGDVVLVRTGFLGDRRADSWHAFNGVDGDAPGLHVQALEWIYGHDVAGVAVDNSAGEVRPFSVPGVVVPFHIVGLVYMGLLLGEIFDLDRLADSCSGDRRYEFFFVAPPLDIAGGLGSPINPYAIK
jgi:kynurenine formamidase